MAEFNSFTIIGNVTKDVELRKTTAGKSVTTYVVAIDHVWYDNNGTKHEHCDFIPVSTYGKQAENDAKYLRKGSSVAVSGRIHSWFKKEERKSGFRFEAEKVKYLGRAAATQPSDSSPVQDPNQELDAWLSDYDNNSSEL